MLNRVWTLVLLSTMLSLGLSGCGGSSSSKTPITEEPNPPIEAPEPPIEEPEPPELPIEAPEPPIEAPEPPLAGQTTIQVMASTGNPLAGATVKILGQTYQTNDQGRIKQLLDLPSSTTDILVEVEKEGFVTQSYAIPVAELNYIHAYLLPVKSQITIPQIQIPQVIEYQPQAYFPKESGWSSVALTVPANAFKRPNGEIATGAAIVEISPWTEHASDLNGILGAGKTANQSLMTAAGVFIQIKNAQGELLSIADRQKLNLRLEAAYKSLNNTPLQVGQSMPMWRFDAATGLWQQQADGQIIAENHFKQGMAFTTEINQLGGWQAAKPYRLTTTSLVKCQQSNQPILCHVNYIATLADGSQLSKTQTVTAAGTPIAIPHATKIQWSAANANTSHIANVERTPETNTLINVQPVTHQPWLQCNQDQQAVACNVTLADQTYAIAKDGGYVATINNASNLTWHARSHSIEKIGQVYRYQGQASSDIY